MGLTIVLISAVAATQRKCRPQPLCLKQGFDGLIFVDITTRARPNH
jgi:hypothetical protein